MNGLLNLDAEPAPAPPHHLKHEVISVKVRPHVAAWLRERALAEATSMNGLIVRMIGNERDGGLPSDCRNWLARQAGQCGCPGRPDEALVIVLRHLADLWPDGARLR